MSDYVTWGDHLTWLLNKDVMTESCSAWWPHGLPVDSSEPGSGLDAVDHEVWLKQSLSLLTGSTLNEQLALISYIAHIVGKSIAVTWILANVYCIVRGRGNNHVKSPCWWKLVQTPAPNGVITLAWSRSGTGTCTWSNCLYCFNKNLSHCTWTGTGKNTNIHHRALFQDLKNGYQTHFTRSWRYCRFPSLSLFRCSVQCH